MCSLTGRVVATAQWRAVLQDWYDGRISDRHACGSVVVASSHLPVDGPIAHTLSADLSRYAAKVVPTIPDRTRRREVARRAPDRVVPSRQRSADPRRHLDRDHLRQPSHRTAACDRRQSPTGPTRRRVVGSSLLLGEGRKQQRAAARTAVVQRSYESEQQKTDEQLQALVERTLATPEAQARIVRGARRLCRRARDTTRRSVSQAERRVWRRGH